MLLGLAVGSQLLLAYVFVGLLAPVFPLLLAFATGFDRKTQGFALGALGAAVAGFIGITLNWIITQAYLDLSATVYPQSLR